MALDVDAFSSTVLPVSSRMLMARLAAMFSMLAITACGQPLQAV